MADGRVVERRESDAGFGWALRIAHTLTTGETVYALYGHMMINSITVNVGDSVTKGEHIGQVDSTGRSTGNHLHFSIRNVNDFGCGYVPSTLATCANDLQSNYRDPLAFIGLIFSNFGPGDTFSDQHGWSLGFVCGPPLCVPAYSQVVANGFSVAGKDFTLDKIEVALSGSNGVSELDMAIRSDSGDQPGPILETFHISGVIPVFPSGAKVSVSSSLRPSLAAGSKYWIVINMSDPNSRGAWDFNTINDIGPLGTLNAFGGSWFISNATRGAFRVTGM
ncbi:MAG TPA: M23 family metallopeptidase [Candidatus Methylomirabilis sp.]|nr:M23 family metallopeptidase [Candidatus Methylomirabilis sp.]